MKPILLFLALWAGLISSAVAQGGMGPGPGTVHTIGGGGGGGGCGGSGPWTCIAQTQLIPTGSTGGTTDPIDCTGANLIILAPQYYSGGTFTSVSDSQSNSYGSPLQDWAHGSDEVRLYWIVPSSVSAAMTFTVAGTGIYATMSVQCWASSGTPAYDAQTDHFFSTGGASVVQSGAASLVTAENNALVIAAVASTDGSPVYSVNSSFTMGPQTAGSGGVFISGGLAFKIVPTIATSVLPIFTMSPASPTTAAATMASFHP